MKIRSGFGLFEGGKRHFAVFGDSYTMAGAFEQSLRYSTIDFVVLDEQDAQRDGRF